MRSRRRARSFASDFAAGRVRLLVVTVQTRTKITAAGLAIAVAVVAAIVVRRRAMSDEEARARAPAASSSAPASARGAGGRGDGADDDAAAGDVASARAPSALAGVNEGGAVRGAIVRATWGSGPGELGHERPQEGNAEGPMSFATAGGELLVLDQVNGRLARFDRETGKPLGTSDAPMTAQDLAVAKDGTVVLLDRLVGKTVTLVDARGDKTGELPLAPETVGDPGMLTGVFVDGDTVYVEKQHGALVPIGKTDGSPIDEGAASLSGRPTRDGALLLSARITSANAGQASLNAFDRKLGALRFARLYQFPRPARAIVLVDGDARGTLYLGVAGAGGVAEIACIDPSDGRSIGRVDVPISTTPEESFRDLAVTDDGTIVVAVRTDEGVTYTTARCP
jgi:hypothetical protein